MRSTSFVKMKVSSKRKREFYRRKTSKGRSGFSSSIPKHLNGHAWSPSSLSLLFLCQSSSSALVSVWETRQKFLGRSRLVLVRRRIWSSLSRSRNTSEIQALPCSTGRQYILRFIAFDHRRRWYSRTDRTIFHHWNLLYRLVFLRTDRSSHLLSIETCLSQIDDEHYWYRCYCTLLHYVIHHTSRRENEIQSGHVISHPSCYSSRACISYLQVISALERPSNPRTNSTRQFARISVIDVLSLHWCHPLLLGRLLRRTERARLVLQIDSRRLLVGNDNDDDGEFSAQSRHVTEWLVSGGLWRYASCRCDWQSCWFNVCYCRCTYHCLTGPCHRIELQLLLPSRYRFGRTERYQIFQYHTSCSDYSDNGHRVRWLRDDEVSEWAAGYSQEEIDIFGRCISSSGRIRCFHSFDRRGQHLSFAFG